MTNPTIVWLRRDLRLADHAALRAAADVGPVIPVYVLDDETPRHRRMGAASRWWLHHSLASLAKDLERLGSRLILRRGKAHEALAAVRRECGARTVHALRHYEPWWRMAEKAVAKTFDLRLHDGNYLAPPGTVLNGSGQPYRIYTPFWRTLQERMPPPPPLLAPQRLAAPAVWPASDRLEDWGLLPTTPDWAGGMRDAWTPGERGAAARLTEFADHAARYDATRNLPSIEGSSRLSGHLHFGEVSPADRSTRSSRNWAGATMPRTLSSSFPTMAPAMAAMAWMGCSGVTGRRRRPILQHGSRAEPVIPSSMQGCANCGQQAGCTTG